MPDSHPRFRNAVLTGACGGLGQALARELLAGGAQVALVGLDRGVLDALAATAPERCAVYTPDVADSKAMQAMAAEWIERAGLPDLVIANAGVAGGYETAEASDLAVMRRMLEINLLGPATTFQPFVQAQRAADTKKRCALVGVASIAGWRGMPGNGAYCASKGGLIRYLESLRAECRGSALSVHTVSPGYLSTALTAGNRFAMPGLTSPEEAARTLLAGVASGREHIVLPRRIGWLSRLLACLPAGLYDQLLSSQPRKPRVGEAGATAIPGLKLPARSRKTGGASSLNKNRDTSRMSTATPGPVTTQQMIALIGAGPSGLAGARNLQKLGIPFQGFEAHSDLGGLWNIGNPRSTVYESAHLISSKTTTEFSEFPMPPGTADYPSHRELYRYFSDFADHFDLRRHFRFGVRVLRVEPVSDSPDTLWRVTVDTGKGEPETAEYKGVVIANGTLAEPNMPRFEGSFDGELLHTSAYKQAQQFKGKRVLIVGAGNSGCDIAVDAVHYAQRVDISVRRGYYFVPKYVFGKPADTLGGKRPLPPWIKQRVDSTVLKWFTGDPARFGFPKPDYKMYESHPVVNSLILHHIGHGDIRVKPDVARFEGHTVHFKDGSHADYDLVLAATGYTLHYPFIAREHLNWQGMAPQLYLNIFAPRFHRLAVLGMIEASGIGWQGRYEQAELMARYFKAQDEGGEVVRSFQRAIAGPTRDLSGGYKYLKLERMAYYVHKDTYRAAVRRTSAAFAPGKPV